MRDFQALEVATQQTFAKRKNAVFFATFSFCCGVTWIISVFCKAPKLLQLYSASLLTLHGQDNLMEPGLLYNFCLHFSSIRI